MSSGGANTRAPVDLSKDSASGGVAEDDNGQLKLLLFSETEAVSIEGINTQDSQNHAADILAVASGETAIDVAVADVDLDADMSIGMRMRIGREQRGWTREDVAIRLKLQAGLVRRIEEDDYSGIAHTVYLRGYLTSYARLLGLPAALAEQVVATSGQEMPLVSTGTVSRSRYMLDRYSVSATYLILTGLVIGPAVWLATHGGLEQNLARTVLLDAPATTLSVEPQGGGLLPDGTVDAQMPPPPAPVLAQPDPSPIVASMAPFATMPQPPVAPVAAESVPAGTHSLTLKLKQASWVEVTSASGEKLEYGLLTAGTERRYSSDGVISVRIGNAEGAEIVADGQAIDLAPFRRANVAHLKVFAQGALATRVDS